MKALAPSLIPEAMRRLTALSEAVFDLDDVGLRATVSIQVVPGVEVAAIDHLGRVTFHPESEIE